MAETVTESHEPAPSPPRSKGHRVRWHPVATHFPIALFAATFGFQLLYLASGKICFFTSSNIMIITGAASMVPALWTGWLDWKKNYRAARTRLFRRKIWLGIGMFVLSATIAIFRNVYFGFEGEIPGLHHTWYTFTLALLIGSAITEGFFGGRLAHR